MLRTPFLYPQLLKPCRTMSPPSHLPIQFEYSRFTKNRMNKFTSVMTYLDVSFSTNISWSRDWLGSQTVFNLRVSLPPESNFVRNAVLGPHPSFEDIIYVPGASFFLTLSPYLLIVRHILAIFITASLSCSAAISLSLSDIEGFISFSVCVFSEVCFRCFNGLVNNQSAAPLDE